MCLESRLAQYTNNCTITNGLGNITRNSGQHFWVGYDDTSQSDDKLILHPLCPYNYCVNYEVVFPLNESDMQCAYNRSGLLRGACKEAYSLVATGHISMLEMYQELPSCLAHSFCSDGNSTGFLTPCLQFDSGNRNTQWASVLCQYCWSQSYNLSTNGIY